MSINPASDLFKALLALDAYNRGYNEALDLSIRDSAGNIIQASDAIGTQIGGVTILRSEASQVSQNASFYAIAYEYVYTEGEGEIQVQKTQAIISYRGTDELSLDGDIPSFFTGLGFLTEQSKLALQFFRDVDAIAQHPISLTGHSLGGGLAGLVSSLLQTKPGTDREPSAVIFDNMAFEAAANNIYGNSIPIPGYPTGNASFRIPAYEGETPWLPATYGGEHSGIYGYSIKGEVLEKRGNRSLQDTPVQSFNIAGAKNAPAIQGIGEIDLHSMNALVIRMFAEEKGQDDQLLIGTDWHKASKYFWPKLFDNDFATSIGMGNIAGNSDNENKLRSVLAYSIIDEGTRVFGDTGIRAFYDDANDLGVAMGVASQGAAVRSHAKQLSEIFIEFAAQLAMNKVLKTDTYATENDVLKGVLSLVEDGAAIKVDFSDVKWQFGLEAPAEIVSRQRLVGALGINADQKQLINQEIEQIKTIVFSATSDFFNYTIPPSQGGAMYRGVSANSSTEAGVYMIIGGAGNDAISARIGGDFIIGGHGVDIVDYSGIYLDPPEGEIYPDPYYNPYSFVSGVEADFSVAAEAGFGTVKLMGSMHTVKDYLFSVEHLILTDYDDGLWLSAPATGVERWFDGGAGGDTVYYDTANIIRDDANFVVQNMEGTGKDHLLNFEVFGFSPNQYWDIVNGYLPGPVLNMAANYIIPDARYSYDINVSENSVVDYSATQNNIVFQLGITPQFSPSYSFASIFDGGGERTHLLWQVPKMIYGSNAVGNTAYIHSAGGVYPVAFTGGVQDDTIVVQTSGFQTMGRITIGYQGGYDQIVSYGSELSPGLNPVNAPLLILMANGILPDQVSVEIFNESEQDGDPLVGVYFPVTYADVLITVDGYGAISIEGLKLYNNGSFVPLQIAFGDGTTWEWGDTAQSASLFDYDTSFFGKGNWDDNILVGYEGQDNTLYGYGGNDIILGSYGNDLIYGGDGDDFIDAGTGINTVYGGIGADTVVMSRYSITNFVDYNALQKDMIVLPDTVSDISQIMTSWWTSPHGPQGLEIYADNTSLLLGIERPEEEDEDAVVRIQLNDGTKLSLAVDREGFITSVTSIGSGGSDDGTYGTPDNDTLHGTAWRDFIYGLAGDDIIWGYGGDDVIVGGTGDDTLHGGSGSDTYWFSVGDGSDIVTDEGGSLDRIRFDATVAVSSVSYIQDGDDLLIRYGAGSDNITVSNFFLHDDFKVEEVVFADNTVHDIDYIMNYLNGSSGTITGTSGADVLHGTSSNDVIRGLAGADILYGYDGDDLLIGGNGNDTLYGGSGNDILRGGNGNDLLIGGAGHDILNGGAGNDILRGGNGDDILRGGDGDDRLIGGRGSDTLVGGTGADTFVFRTNHIGHGVDTIKDFSLSQGDKIDIRDLLSAYDPVTDALADFVQFTRSGKKSIMSVDVDGAGTDYGWVQVAVINGHTSLDPDQLVATGHLLVA